MRLGHRPLFEDQNAGHNERKQCRRSDVAAWRQAAGINRLVQKIANHCTQRARRDERRPKQQGAR